MIEEVTETIRVLQVIEITSNQNKNKINNAKKPNNLSIIIYEINVALLKNLYLLIRYIIFIKSPPVAPGKH